jgi:hypothetical protein
MRAPAKRFRFLISGDFSRRNEITSLLAAIVAAWKNDPLVRRGHWGRTRYSCCTHGPATLQ